MGEAGARRKGQGMTRPSSEPALALGDRIRLVEGGPICTVYRVTPCAAYVRSAHPRPHPDPARAAVGEVIQSTRVEPISARACVWREA